MAWRYQPVICSDDAGEYLSICEVYFDASGRFDRWTEAGRWPAGEDIPELASDLVRMLMDTWKWKPVRCVDLKPGYEFERAISQEQCEGIAQMIETVDLAAKPRTV